MSNNAYATLEGGEIGIAQGIQAEACGLRPVAEMNPILLKPSSDSRSQVIQLGKAGKHLKAREYYKTIPSNWDIVTSTLEDWKSKCDVLVMEGAGSPVELNLLHKDIANLKPVHHVDGKWILVGDIERGGVFAQIIGTWNLMSDEDKKRGLGFIVNKFRGDPSLFDEAKIHFEQRMSLPYLGLLPLRTDLYIEDEDSLSTDQGVQQDTTLPYIAWIKYPRVSNTQDQLPWQDDQGITSRWVTRIEDIENAAAVVLPGSKESIADLMWLREKKLDQAILRKAKTGAPIVGICGGFQMLGESITDHSNGYTNTPGLALLPIRTEFEANKQVIRRMATYAGHDWETYEIHMGQSEVIKNQSVESLLHYKSKGNEIEGEGLVFENVWGTYFHGLFESPAMRQRLISAARLENITVEPQAWAHKRNQTYQKMGTFLEDNLDMSLIREYLEI